MKLWISRERLGSSAAIGSASAEELRTLIALIAHEGEDISPEMIAETAGVARSRAIAAIALFTDEGILRESASITEEFEERLRLGEIIEEPATEVAKTIRDEGLASLIDEVARFMKKAALSTSEVKIIAGLISQYSLSPEYILLLASHLSTLPGVLTATRLRDRAVKLAESEVTTVEELEKYIEAKSAESDIHREFRRVMGLYRGALSKSQKEYFNRWGLELGFDSAIVAEAYDRAALHADNSMAYMDKLLTSWHEAGCKTVAECKAYSLQNKGRGKKAEGGKGKPEPKRYGDFDINEAFERALERSYGSSDKENDGR